ncbi:MAG: ribosomal-processing cysteine protease Prp [Lachnospiraceae bacterium]|jgi:hypothetical protein|nr:ribosomal-processing cysteine protease Prp [Lachnospiraceae bacterium]
MTKVCIWRKDNKATAFEAYGHAGYAKAGIDVVCSAISILVSNTINSLELLCHEKIDVTVDEESGLMRCVFKDVPSDSSQLLVDSMLLGLRQIQDEYGNKYIDIRLEEV